MADEILIEKSGGVATVTLNRPDRLNALNRRMLGELIPPIWGELDADPSVRAVILTGAGDRAFCSGLDVKEQAEGPPPPGERRPRAAGALSPRESRFSKPVITAVNGLVSGVGLAFVSDADIAIAAEHAYFFNPGVTIGQLAVYAPLTWSRWVPFQSLMRMLLVGNKERIYAEEAKTLGIVTEVLPAAELMPKARELAEMIAYNSPRAVRDVKRIMWNSLDHGLEAAFADARAIMDAFAGHPDSYEGSRALVEKRTPNWAPLETEQRTDDKE